MVECTGARWTLPRSSPQCALWRRDRGGGDSGALRRALRRRVAAARCVTHHVTNRPKARLAWLAIVVVLLRLAGAYYSLHAPSYRWANPGGSHARQSPHKPNPTGARPRPDPGDRRLRRELQLNRQRRRWQQL